MTEDQGNPTLAQRVIERAEHGISRRQISPNALRVLYRLKEAGHQACLVGGAVRDLLLGLEPKDFDVATDATPEQVRQLFRNCRLIGRRFRLAHVMFGREIIEVATFRANSDDGSGDRELENGRLVRDNVYGTIEEDAVRRDFTANALYYDIADFSVRDFVGGYDDVRARVLRLIGDPESRYREDPVRMLRAVRLAAKLGMGIDPAAAEPIPRLAPLLADAPPARLFEEMLKLFLAGCAHDSLLGLEHHGLLPVLFPDTAAALADDAAGGSATMLVKAMANTDRRVHEDKPVTPAFLFAALLWPAYCRERDRLLASGLEAVVAEQRAADRVVLQQVQTIALPRRFATPMIEIWLLQPRFAVRQRKRVMRFMAHPRFRAAYDFLELRVIEDPSLAEEQRWWAEAQQLDAEALGERLHAGTGGGDVDGEGARRGKRRRGGRRRRRPGGGEGGGAGA